MCSAMLLAGQQAQGDFPVSWHRGGLEGAWGGGLAGGSRAAGF